MKYTYFAFFLIIGLVFSACSENDDSGLVIKTGRVTFVNESGHKVVVHQDYFNGPILLEMSGSDLSKTINVRTSDNHGIGSIFSIEYLYRINKEDDFVNYSGEVIASGIDPNVQLKCVVEENKSHTIRIPEPANLEFRSAFIKISNSSALQCDLRYLGTVFKQTNSYIYIPPGNTGVYRLEGIPNNGRLYQNYEVAANFERITIPDFTVMNGFIYSFTYDGNMVHDGSKEKKPEPNIQPIIFR